MKKYIILALCACLCFLHALYPIQTRPAQADQSDAAQAESYPYACILTDNAFFYASEDEEQGLFLLPKTYFVKVLSKAEPYSKIEYLTDGDNVKKVVGYAKTNQLTFVSYTPETPYLYKQFDVQYRLEGETLDDPSFLHRLTVTCTYYGDYKIGSKTYCYILRGDTFGYIPKPTDFSYAENPEYEQRLSIQQTDVPTDAPPAAEEEGNTSPAQIAILIALCLLIPVLAALILKPARSLPPEED